MVWGGHSLNNVSGFVNLSLLVFIPLILHHIIYHNISNTGKTNGFHQLLLHVSLLR